MSYEINLRLSRFGYGTVHPNRPNDSYIEFILPLALRGLKTPRPLDLVNSGTRPGPATISGCTITMDLGTTVCFITDRLARGPDQ